MTIKEVSFGATRLPIKKFNINEMVDHCTIAMIAKRATGKSFLTREIMFQKKNIVAAVAISRTEKLNSFYSEFIPDSYIYSEYNSDVLTRIYNRQSIMNEDNKRRIKSGKPPKDDSLMLIMDDCMSSKGTWLKDPNILELFFNGRHHHISFILTMQFSLGIPPEMRSNFDYIFLLAEDQITNRKRLYDHYAGIFPTFDIFQQVFSDLTENYGILVINNRVHSKNITDKIFWYKAKKVPTFKIGTKKFRDFHNKSYNENWDKNIEVFNPESLIVNKRNTLRVTVDKIS
jgi:hypothetical protein|uniref:Uncharacterized protein n=1 Tax=viral metagenome TaxID=1070528 RepID=A0A6C0ECZ2_9ZZZZ